MKFRIEENNIDNRLFNLFVNDVRTFTGSMIEVTKCLNFIVPTKSNDDTCNALLDKALADRKALDIKPTEFIGLTSFTGPLDTYQDEKQPCKCTMQTILSIGCQCGGK
jgi:hypothetical protein